MGGSATWYTMSTSDTTTAPRMPATRHRDPMGCWMWSMQSELCTCQILSKALQYYQHFVFLCQWNCEPAFKAGYMLVLQNGWAMFNQTPAFESEGPTHFPPNKVPLVRCDKNDKQIINHGSRVTLSCTGRSLFALGACYCEMAMLNNSNVRPKWKDANGHDQPIRDQVGLGCITNAGVVLLDLPPIQHHLAKQLVTHGPCQGTVCCRKWRVISILRGGMPVRGGQTMTNALLEFLNERKRMGHNRRPMW